jgi:SAM-dependent methyltransferase
MGVRIDRGALACLAAVAFRYDTIGTGYARHRRPDPRIAAQIDRALGPAGSVISIGSGTGSYDPRDRRVVAVEPSEVMVAQRPARSAPVARGVAEALPVADRSFDAALATLTVHHWSDPTAGLQEMQRVAPRQVVLTFDQDDAWLDEFWLTRDYLPHDQLGGALYSGLDRTIEVLQPARVEIVPVPSDCRDGFFCAYWRRPEAYLDPEVRSSISVLALLDPDALRPGMERLARDLRSGAWHERNPHLLGMDSYDYGYRLVVASSP